MTYWNDNLIACWVSLRGHRKVLNRGFSDPEIVVRHLELIGAYRAETVKTAKRMAALDKERLAKERQK